jgi:7-cyano-7-deazaguanosine (preQ0) biosynthesis protein QueE
VTSSGDGVVVPLHRGTAGPRTDAPADDAAAALEDGPTRDATAIPSRRLVVSEVFGPTFQGEGPSIGRRAAFVRLGRCNLTCTWCDTPYTWDWERFDPAAELPEMDVEDVVARIEAMAPEIVVVTGGEPLLQQRRLLPLVEACAERGWPVEVETNGTIAPSSALVDLVTRWNVSPKLANSGVDRARRESAEDLAVLMATGRAVFKFVVADESELDEVGAMVVAHDLGPVWIMPEGTDPATVMERTRALADPVLARGWNLTPRLHVLLWGDQRGR